MCVCSAGVAAARSEEEGRKVECLDAGFGRRDHSTYFLRSCPNNFLSVCMFEDMYIVLTMSSFHTLKQMVRLIGFNGIQLCLKMRAPVFWRTNRYHSHAISVFLIRTDTPNYSPLWDCIFIVPRKICFRLPA